MKASPSFSRLRLLLASCFLLVAAACNAGYGPREDHSEFTSVHLADDGDTVLFAWNRHFYRRATGIRAFPNGGVPKYEIDVNFLGTWNRKSGKLEILRRQENRDWQPGQGNFTIQDVNGPYALVAQGGQLRGPFARDYRYLLVDWKRQTITELDLEDDLAERGRDPYFIRLAMPDGTLLFETSSLEEGQTPNVHRKPGFVPELWVRTPAGEYLKIAASKHYEKVENGEVIYWDPHTRDFIAFSLKDRSSRVLPDYRKPPYQGEARGVKLSSDKQQVEYGTKSGGQWTYQPLPLDPSGLK